MPFLRNLSFIRRSVVALGLVSVPAAAVTQQDGSALATRASLQEELARLQQGGNAQGGGRGGGTAAALIRARLENGDFQVGDRLFLQVDGEQQLTDTFTVNPGVELDLPQVGTISLRGVLRSELKDKLTAHLSQYLRAPAVEVRPLMRLLVDGQVTRPGFYAAAPEQPLADVITLAGGLTQLAKPAQMRVERGQATIISGPRLQEALGRGYSLDRLNLQAGDRVFVPTRGDSERTLRILGLLLSVPMAVFAISRVF